MAGGGADRERAAEGLDAFAHLLQAKVTLLRPAWQGGGVEAQAVIAHPQEEAGAQVERHPDAACLGVTGDVVQRLLHDAEEHRLQRGRQLLTLALHGDNRIIGQAALGGEGGEGRLTGQRCAARPVEAVQPAVRPGPERPAGVLIERPDEIVAQAVGMRRIGAVLDESFCVRVEAQQRPRLLGADPERAAGVFQDALDRAAPFPGEMLEAVGAAVETVEADLSADPQVAAAVLVEGGDVVMGQAGGIGGVVAEVGHLAGAAVETVEAVIVQPNPDEALTVLPDRADGGRGQAVRVAGAGGVEVEAQARARVLADAAAFGGDPQVAAAVEEQGSHLVIAEAEGVERVVAEGLQAAVGQVVAVEAVLGADPERLAFEKQGGDVMVAQRLVEGGEGAAGAVEARQAAQFGLVVVPGADPQRAVGGKRQGGDSLEGRRARRRVRVGGEAAGARVEGGQAAVVGPDPERAAGVEEQGVDVVIGQTGGVSGVVQVLGESAADCIVAEDAAAGGADPQISGRVFGEGAHRFVHSGIVDEAARGGVVAVEAADGAHPQAAAAVFVESVDRVVDQRIGVGAVMVEVGEGVAVVAAESPLCAKPEIAGAVLQEAVDDVVRQAIGGSEVAEAQVAALGADGESGEEQGEEQDCANKTSMTLYVHGLYSDSVNLL